MDELVKYLLLSFGLAITLIYTKNKSKELLRVGSFFLIIFVALYANNDAVYIFSILIGGTLIASETFIKDIVAIIKGSKEYFDYKKELIKASPEEIKEEVVKKSFSLDLLSAFVTKGIKGETKKKINYKKIIKEAFKEIEKIFNSKVEKYVKIPNTNIILHGVIFGKEDKVIEIAIIDNLLAGREKISETIEELTNKLQVYRAFSRKEAKGILCVIYKEGESEKERIKALASSKGIETIFFKRKI